MISSSGMSHILIEGFRRVVLKPGFFKDEWRSWLFVSVWCLEGEWRKLHRNYFPIEVPHMTHDHSPLPGKMARLCLRRTSGVGPIFPASCISNNLLVPGSHKDSRMIRYAPSKAVWLCNMALTSGTTTGRGRCGGSPRRILERVLENFLGTQREEILCHR